MGVHDRGADCAAGCACLLLPHPTETVRRRSWLSLAAAFIYTRPAALTENTVTVESTAVLKDPSPAIFCSAQHLYPSSPPRRRRKLFVPPSALPSKPVLYPPPGQSKLRSGPSPQTKPPLPHITHIRSHGRSRCLRSRILSPRFAEHMLIHCRLTQQLSPTLPTYVVLPGAFCAAPLQSANAEFCSWKNTSSSPSMARSWPSTFG